MMNINPEFTKAVDAGLVVPAIDPNTNNQLEIEGILYYQVADHGTKMMLQRFNQYVDAMQKHESLRLNDVHLRTALSLLSDIIVRQNQTIVESFRQGAFDNDSFQLLTELMQEQSRVHKRLTERLDIGFDLQRSYEIAAIWFITSDEDPAYTTAAKLKQKVSAFMSRPDLYAFFLSLPLSNFNPLSVLFDKSIQNLIYEQTLLESLDLRQALLKSNQLGLKNETISSIQSLEADLSTSLDTIEQLSMISTDNLPQ